MIAHIEALHDHACLIVHGPDQPGIVSAVSALITRNTGNIVQLDQYSDDADGGNFFQRVVFHRPDLAAAMPDDRGGPHQDGVRARAGVDADRSVHPEAHGDPGLHLGSLPARAALAAPPRRAAGDDPDGHLQPHQHRRGRPLVRHPVLPRPLPGAGQVRRRGEDPRARSGERRLHRARPLHADHLRGLPRRGGRAGDQHPPLLPARLHRRGAVPQGQGARREADRRDVATTSRRTSTRARSSSRTSPA